MSTPGAGRHREDEPRPRRHVVAGTVRVVAAACSLILFVGIGYGWYNYHSLVRHTNTIAIAGLGAATPSPGDSAAAGLQHVDGDAQNILVVGVDSRAGLTDAEKRYYRVGQDDAATSTDTIIVIHVPADGSRATLVSIPRDTYVDIPGHPSNKINAAYIDGYDYGGAATDRGRQAAGIDLLVAVVKNLTGLRIDHYVQVGFSGFVDIVKAIGSVPIDLCESVDDTYAHNRAHGISGASGFKLSAGRHDLTPQQALEFVRQRHNIPGPVPDDLGREARQRYFLRQAFTKIETAHTLLNPFTLRRLISAVDSAFTFDNTGGFGFQQFAAQISDLSAGNITGISIPTTGYATYPAPVGSAITVDVAQVRARVHRLFYPTPAPGASRSSASRSAGPAGSSSTPRSSGTAPSAAGSSATGDAGCIH